MKQISGNALFIRQLEMILATKQVLSVPSKVDDKIERALTRSISPPQRSLFFLIIRVKKKKEREKEREREREH